MRVLLLLSVFSLALAPAPQREVHFEAQQIRDDFGVGYAVTVGDVNGDRKPDILAISGTQLVWFEESVVAGARRARRADAEGQRHAGAARHRSRRPARRRARRHLEAERHERRRHAPLGVAGRGRRPTWTLRDIASEPTLHRIRWANVDGAGDPELIVAPLHGRGTSPPEWNGVGPRLLALRVPKDPARDAVAGRARSTTRCTSSTTSRCSTSTATATTS